MHWTTRFLVATLTIVATASSLWGCGGAALSIAGGGTDGTGSPAQFSEGVMTKGSVILNGVRYEDTGTVVLRDGRTTTAVELASGMVVKLRGAVNADGVTGVADRVAVENEVRGAISSVNVTAQPATFVVIGQTVIVDNKTLYANVNGSGGLTVGQRVEVHGLRDATGAIRASRVELAAAGLPDELKGVVSNLTATTFSLGNVTVNFAAATITPTGATIANGNPVEVRGIFNVGTGILVATNVTRDDLNDPLLQPGAGDKLEVEGFISNLNASTSMFVVKGRMVRYSSATRFEGGSAAELADNVKVEAEGSIDANGVLVATKIEFEQGTVILQGLASAVDVVQRRVTVLGQTISLDGRTEVRAVDAAGRESTQLTDISANVDRVQVRGHLSSTGALIVERIEERSETDDQLQGRVSAKNEAARTLTVLGVNVSLANAVFRQEESVITASAFYAAITLASGSTAGTVVKVKGTFAAGALNAREARIEH